MIFFKNITDFIKYFNKQGRHTDVPLPPTPFNYDAEKEARKNTVWSFDKGERIDAALEMVRSIEDDCAHGVLVVDEYKALFVLRDAYAEALGEIGRLTQRIYAITKRVKG